MFKRNWTTLLGGFLEACFSPPIRIVMAINYQAGCYLLGISFITIEKNGLTFSDDFQIDILRMKYMTNPCSSSW